MMSRSRAQRHEPGPPMDLANMREQGVHHLITYSFERRVPVRNMLTMKAQEATG
jgi:hypothetical protein